MMLAPFNLLLACHLFLTCTALRGTFSNSFFCGPVCKTVAARAGRRAAGDAVLDDVGAILDASYIQSAPETLGQLSVT